MNIIGIIQARMGSTRLPGKVLKEINGKAIIEILLERLSFSNLLNDVVIATTETKQDDVLSEWLHERNINFFAAAKKMF